MKLLTKEEEQAHYRATVKGGVIGGVAGLGIGFAAVVGATRRYPAFNTLTLPLKAFLVTSSATFASIVAADRASRAFEAAQNTANQYRDQSSILREAAAAQQTTSERISTWAREHRYPIVGASWVASIVGSFVLVNRNKYLTGAQKIVQARVYAQGLTLAVLCATAVFEIQDQKKGIGRWETVKILDPNDPEHKRLIEKRIHHERYRGEDLWRDMVENEEMKMKQRHEALTDGEEKARKEKRRQRLEEKNGNGNGKPKSD